MMFIELFVPKDTLSKEQLRHLSERLITEMSKEEEEGVPAEVIEANRALQQVIIHEPETWIVGGRLVNSTEAPRYIIRVSVPASWRKAMSAHVISRFTKILAEADENPQRLYQKPEAWIQVIGIPEGSYGMFGEVMLANDLIRIMTKSFRESPDREAFIKAAAPGTAIDPICGMTVPLTDTAITLELDGMMYAFCSAGCRQVFLEEQRGMSHE